MSPRDPDSWEGAIVRGRDGRKGLVLRDARPLFGGRSTLTVHWENEEVEDGPREQVTMLRPPIGFQPRVTAEDHERGIRWGWVLIYAGLFTAAITLATWAIGALSGGY